MFAPLIAAFRRVAFRRPVGKVGAAALCLGLRVAMPIGAEALPSLNTWDEPQVAQGCGSEIILTPYDAACSETPDTAADRAYLVETATPGFTMVRQGVDVAIGRLNPEFVRRLAGAIREARSSGLEAAGIFSAYRPPAFGVGGFSNKFNSLHSYGLAVDMTGIGGPGSAEARSWYGIAARHDVVCPYGVENRLEWNHCQPTSLKIIRSENPLRETITADGPANLESMFEAGAAVIDNPGDHPNAKDMSGPAVAAAGQTADRGMHAAAHAHEVASAHLASNTRSRCQEEARPHASGCAASHASQSAERERERRTMHARADHGTRENHRA